FHQHPLVRRALARARRRRLVRRDDHRAARQSDFGGDGGHPAAVRAADLEEAVAHLGAHHSDLQRVRIVSFEEHQWQFTVDGRPLAPASRPPDVDGDLPTSLLYSGRFMSTPVDIAPARGKLGVLLVGLGAVSTTTIAGVFAIRKGSAKPIGSLTQMGTVRLGKRTEARSPLVKEFVPLADLDDLVFGGWDIFEDNCY